MNLFQDFLVAVMAEITAHFVCKWFVRNSQKDSKPPSLIIIERKKIHVAGTLRVFGLETNELVPRFLIYYYSMV